MKIDIVRADDWEGLYLFGVLYGDGHNIRVEDLLECFKSEFTLLEVITDFDYVISYVNQEWMEEQGSFPRYLRAIPKEVYR